MKTGVVNVLVLGSRKWDSWDALRAALEPYFGVDVTLRTAHTNGAERMAEYVWENWGGTVKPVIPNWDKFGKGAGYRAVEGLALSQPDVCLAFLTNEADTVMERNLEIVGTKGITIVKFTADATSEAETPTPANAGSVTDPSGF